MARRRRSGADTACTVVATICCLPCICVVGFGMIGKDVFVKLKNYESPKKRERRQYEAQKKMTMRRTPRRPEPRLERSLTIPLPEVMKVEGKEVMNPQMTHHQLGSNLFKLPLEIRRMIYGEAIGGYVFHISFLEAYRKMGHSRCKMRFPEICKGVPCRQLHKQKGAADAWGNVDLLSLLLSCRRM